MIRKIISLKSVFRVFLYWIGIALGGILFIYQAWISYKAIHARDVVIVNYSALGLSAGLIILAMSLQIGAWRELMRGIGVKISWHDTFENYVLSFLPKYIPGTVWGYFNRAEWLHKTYKANFSVSHLGSLLELILISTGIIFSIGLYGMKSWMGNSRFIFAIALMVFPYIVWRALLTLIKLPIIQNTLNLDPKGDGLEGFHFRLWIILSGLHFLSWLLYGYAFYWIVQSIEMSSEVELITLTMVFASSWLLGFMVLFVPGGLGIREQSLARLLVSLTTLSFSQANSISVLSRFLMIMGEVSILGVGIVLRWLRRYIHEK